jgi:hypothetical protein
MDIGDIIGAVFGCCDNAAGFKQQKPTAATEKAPDLSSARASPSIPSSTSLASPSATTQASTASSSAASLVSGALPAASHSAAQLAVCGGPNNTTTTTKSKPMALRAASYCQPQTAAIPPVASVASATTSSDSRDEFERWKQELALLAEMGFKPSLELVELLKTELITPVQPGSIISARGLQRVIDNIVALL